MRRLSLFALIFIVLASLYWLLEGQRGKESDREPNYLLSSFEPANVALINISNSSSGTIVLQRADGVWQVATEEKTFYAADSFAIKALIEFLAKLKTDSMVSRNPERHALYEVNPETGIQVEVLGDGGTLANVLIGKSGPNIFSTYVRAADKDEVYLVDGILQNAASKTLNEWRDKTIFSFDPELATTYTIIGNPSLSLKKIDGKWEIEPEYAPANTAAAEQAVRTLATLSAADFAEGPLEDFGLTKPERTVTAELKDGSSMTLLMGKDKNAFQQYAKTADADTVYIVEKHILDMLCPSIEELKTPAPDATEEETPAAPAELPTATNR